MKKLDFSKRESLMEVIRYGFAGACVTLSNVGIFEGLRWLGVVYTVANLFALLGSKTIGYLLNKFWVYKSQTTTLRETLAELGRFILARGFTGVVDYVGLIVLVELLGMNQSVAKWLVMAVVIVLNYVLGKVIVFMRTPPHSNTSERQL